MEVVRREDVAEGGSCKMQKADEQGHDMISKLPDSVLIHILSFLPIADAVKTILLRRFKHLWTSIPNLDFCERTYAHIIDEDGYYNVKCLKWFVNFVNNALILHERSTIHKFRLSLKFYFDNSFEEDMHMLGGDEVIRKAKKISGQIRDVAIQIDTWIRFAIRREVKVLDLDFLGGCGDSSASDFPCTLPFYVFNNNLLTEMKLVYCGIEPSWHFYMGSLKSLSLKYIRLPNETIDCILSGCPMLEDLTLIRCYDLTKLRFTSPNLKNLIIYHFAYEKSMLEICCPNLLSLRISECIDWVHLMNVSSVVDAALEFSFHFKFVPSEFSEFRMLLEKLRHSKVLTMCTWCVLVFAIWEAANIPFPLSNWKHVVLKTMLSKWHLLGIASLLRSAPNLEILTIHICAGGSSLDRQQIGSYDLDGGSYWNEQESTCHCLTNHLKTVTIFGFSPVPCAMQLVEFLLQNAVALEKIMIYTKRNKQTDQHNQFSADELLEFTKKLLNFPRASKHAVILFS
ncbi:PREDICTED: putative F-box/LRR-repeat protein At5g54820 [Nelumbo nucifera]|uniref:FBD domain-containing protein n=2 Tax=Nelumbo nucifera TaxID=4432 RepID=A0A822YRB9_NELNU|nr:PREDICTED: putative F-box/LRR-repeat protein At5g54820 [Nelumbo nucifera]DAD33939.1 TPA_asm: hypothetical protein HUJ06_012790 [Nelumbo nucifera]